MTSYKVQTRQACAVCATPIKRPSRFRTFCSTRCRTYNQNRRHYPSRAISERLRRDKANEQPNHNKIRCEICGRFYRQPLSHAYQRHHITAYEYKRQFNLETTHGLIPDDLREQRRQAALDNDMPRQLTQVGKPTRFKPHQRGLGVYQRTPDTLAKLAIARARTPAHIKHNQSGQPKPEPKTEDTTTPTTETHNHEITLQPAPERT